MDLSTRYLGMDLRNPLVVSASPLSDEVDSIKRTEDAGAAAVVLFSLFEEQITHQERALAQHLDEHAEAFAEAQSFFPEPALFPTGPTEYLEHIRKAKEAVGIPVIASLNGATVGGWTDYASRCQQAGADALELNIYRIPTDPKVTSEQVENEALEIVRAVKGSVSIPVAVKLGPYYSSFANMASRLDEAGADGLVIFNRFYQPEIDIDTLEVRPRLALSEVYESRLPITWIAILWGRIRADLAATSGVAYAEGVIQALMAGASVAMITSALLRRGIEHLGAMERMMRVWMEEHEYESVQQMQGSMSQKRCPDPTAFERFQYMKLLHSYKPE